MQVNPINAIDAYKLDHRRQYPEGTTRVYSNFTPRAGRIPSMDGMIFFGLQAFLHGFCTEEFGKWFKRPTDEVCDEYAAMCTRVLGPNNIGTDHIRDLHKLGYLPVQFNALPEGTLVPFGVPAFTIHNTDPRFFWLVNYLETALSAEIWLPSTSATQAFRLRKLLDTFAKQTGTHPDFVPWQAHDFSFRGHGSIQSAMASGAGHLTSFTGSDTIPAIDFVDRFYPGDNGLVAGSVAATEHSVMCAGGKDGELETISRLLDLYPSGILSVVSDTWDLWDVLDVTLPKLKAKIMAREGKLVIRPDSGNPADILCGTATSRGVVERLGDVFGYTVNSAGFKELDPHVGVIYGDSISYERALEIGLRLQARGWASGNVVLGVGSYTYQYVTRDTLGIAMKATQAVVAGESRDLYKDPVTDRAASGGTATKKSATGLLSVVRGENGRLTLLQRANEEQMAASLMEPVWADGKFLRALTFAQVRENVRKSLAA